MSDTPQTDDCETNWQLEDLARTLERENAKLKSALILARKWGLFGKNFSATVAYELGQWVDDGMKGPALKGPYYYPKD